MGKNPSLFRLPVRPTGTIRLLSAYDGYFREHLLDAIRDDRERFDDGLPTYHSNMLRIVKDYAGGVVDPEELSLKDLANFLKGMRSHVPRIQVLDAYLQIVNPQARVRCFPDVALDAVGSAVSDYLKSPGLTPYDRETLTRKFVGAYALRKRGTARDYVARFLFVARATSSNYVLLYEFNQPELGASEPDQLKLRTGFAVPQPATFLFLMKDYLYLRRYVGSLRPSEDRRPMLTIASLVARERNDVALRGDLDHAATELGSSIVHPQVYDPIYDDKTSSYIESVVNSFEGVL